MNESKEKDLTDKERDFLNIIFYAVLTAFSVGVAASCYLHLWNPLTGLWEIDKTIIWGDKVGTIFFGSFGLLCFLLFLYHLFRGKS